ncbi:hypothetical protein D3C76_365940 [compost metagenome]
MRDNRTAHTLHLVSVLQERHGPYPLGRAALITWIGAELDTTPGDAGVRRIEAAFPAHLVSLLSDTDSQNLPPR